MFEICNTNFSNTTRKLPLLRGEEFKEYSQHCNNCFAPYGYNKAVIKEMEPHHSLIHVLPSSIYPQAKEKAGPSGPAFSCFEAYLLQLQARIPVEVYSE